MVDSSLDLYDLYGITPLGFARKHGGLFKEKKEEISFKRCLYCDGGKHNDIYTAYLNKNTGTYYCHRGSCSVSGKAFKELLRDFGELNTEDYNGSLQNNIISLNQQEDDMTSFSKPEKGNMEDLSDEILSYFKDIRGLSEKSIEYFDIKEEDGNIVFPYYENGELVMKKFRSPDNKKKIWKNDGGKEVFFGIDKIDVDKPLAICEGEVDAMAIIESGYENVVSVPMGSNNLSCLDYAWDKIEEIDEFIIFPDNDEPGRKMKDELVRRLGAGRCSVVDSDYADPNAHLYHESKESLRNAIESAEPVEVDGLVDLSEVETLDFSKITRIKSNVGKINTFTGGFLVGSTSVWTGRNGSGKSSFLGQQLIEAVDQNYNVMAYSGELNAGLFQYWIELQMAGPHNVLVKKDSPDDEGTYKVNPDVIKDMREWYAGKFFLFDSSRIANTSNLLETFRYAARRHGVRLFLIDNLMTVGFESSESNYYRKQSEFIRKMVSFSKRFDVHVMIVAHPRKSEGNWVRKEDISGTYNISDQVDFVFSIRKITDEDREENDKFLDTDSALLLDKNRMTGKDKKVIHMKFNERSKRFCQESQPSNLNKKYGWETS